MKLKKIKMKSLKKLYTVYKTKSPKKDSKLYYLSFDLGFFKPYYDYLEYDGAHHTLSLVFIRLFWGVPTK
jgi:hypothetical protein